ncbi:MAG: flagellar biosynthetic protein FliO [Acidobacteriota bacterium]
MHPYFSRLLCILIGTITLSEPILLGVPIRAGKEATAVEGVAQSNPPGDVAFESTADATASSSNSETSLLPMSVRAVGAMTFIAGLILVFGLVARRFLPPYLKSAGNHRFMEVVESIPVGERQRLALIRIADETLLVGITSSQLSLLKAVDLPKLDTPKVTDARLRGQRRLDLISTAGWLRAAGQVGLSSFQAIRAGWLWRKTRLVSRLSATAKAPFKTVLDSHLAAPNLDPASTSCSRLAEIRSALRDR